MPSRMYTRSFFFVDLVGSDPIQTIGNGVSDKKSSSIFSVVELLKNGLVNLFNRNDCLHVVVFAGPNICFPATVINGMFDKVILS